MSKITLSVDSTADLGDELYKKYDLRVINLGVVIGETVYVDSEITAQDIYKAMEVDNLVPRTNAALEVDYRELFEEATKDGGSIIHFNLSSQLSASHANAKRAAQGLPRVYIVDTKTMSVGTGFAAIKARELVNAGRSADEIVLAITEILSKMDTSLIINDLKYLHKGGRVTGIKLLGANLLKIRPSLQVEPSGKLVPGKKFKGKFSQAVKEWVQYKIESNPNANKEMLVMAHSDMEAEVVQSVYDEFKAAGFKEVLCVPLGTTVTTHCGRNTIGAVIIND